MLILRHDTNSVRGELYAFVFRVAGLVVIIAAFTTVVIWMALEPLVINPIFQLRRDLQAAGEAISKDIEPPEFYSASVKRFDELGDVIAAFNKMYHQISEAISDRDRATAALKESFLKVESLSETLKKELVIGREIQKNFLPSEILKEPGWEMAAFFQPAREVAGDFYDIFKLSDGNVGLVIADVCDKGVGAALFMGLFRSLIRIFSSETKLRGNTSAILEGNQPVGGWIGDNASTNLAHLTALQAVSRTNDYVAEHHGELGMFATLFFGVLDPASGLLTYINGGHEPLFIIHPKGGVKENLKSTGPAVGMLPNMNFKLAQTYLQPGEILIGYTDGVPEARAKDGKFFTAKQLLSILEEPVTNAITLVDHISLGVLAHTGDAEQFDDITILAVRRESLG